MDFKDLKKIFGVIFSEKSEIIAVYLFGSILLREDYSDVDIGILIEEDFKLNPLYEVKIACELEKILKEEVNIYIPIDICILNNKSLRFLFSILKNSKILYCNNELKRVQFEAKVMKEYLDFKPHDILYNKMRRLRYASR